MRPQLREDIAISEGRERVVVDEEEVSTFDEGVVFLRRTERSRILAEMEQERLQDGRV